MNEFLMMTLLAGLGASVAGGVVGSYVVIKRIVFICGSIAHSVMGGMGLFLYLSRVHNLPLEPIYGALVAALISAFLIGWIRLNYHQREDTVIAAIWAFGMASGVIFISLTPGYNVELINFLFGNILWTSHSDILMLLGLDISILLISAIFHRRFLAISFDEVQAKLQRLQVGRLYFLLLALVAITTTLLIQIVGSILLIAILTLPAAMANTYTIRLFPMICLAILLSIGMTFLGIYLSFVLNWPPGATIALTSTICYLAHLPTRKLVSLKKIN